MDGRDIEALRAYWQGEEGKAFIGWDFSHIADRSSEEPLPWDYDAMVRKYLSPGQRLLDMETGGGEFLHSLGHPPANTFATENWEPNYRLLLDTLVKEGICIKKNNEDGSLPFADNFFDIVLNRHGSFYARELMRVMKPGGIFVTEQVGGDNNLSLSRRLIPDYMPAYPKSILSIARQDLEAAGLRILLEGESYPALRFFDIGALVWYAKVIAWEFPGFSVEKCFDNLLALQQEIEEEGCVHSLQHRYYIVARKGE